MTNEELQEEIKRLEEQLTELRFKISKSKVDDKPYKVEVPEDIENYYYVDELGDINLVGDTFHETDYEGLYLRGLAFKTREEAEKFDKERILLFKMHKWAEEHNGDWIPNWKEDDEPIHEVQIDRFPMYGCDSPLVINEVDEVRSVSIFPYFHSYKTAREFIEEFRGEIEEVFC
jgi:hypothetical protein|nr:MAG TPA: 30S ribosomal protein S2 [Caudoviricetes sp.]